MVCNNDSCANPLYEHSPRSAKKLAPRGKSSIFKACIGVDIELAEPGTASVGPTPITLTKPSNAPLPAFHLRDYWQGRCALNCFLQL